MANINRSLTAGQHTLHDFDGAIDSGTKTAGIGEQDLHNLSK
jgi:hypothetical protein